MRITRQNVEALIEIAERLKNACDNVAEPAQEWLDGQDEEPKTEDVRDSIRESRDGIEEQLQELQDAMSEMLRITGSKVIA